MYLNDFLPHAVVIIKAVINRIAFVCFKAVAKGWQAITTGGIQRIFIKHLAKAVAISAANLN